MQILIFKDKESWIESVMQKLFDVVAYDSNLMIGLAGGNTPREVYERLGLSILDRNSWKKLNFVTIDERDVPFESEGSNFGMIKSFLPNGNILHFERDFPDKGLIVKKMDKNLRIYKQGKYIFDLLILGMGNDGHIASIFPGFNNEKMFNPKFLSTYTKVPGNEFEDRFTLTFSALNSSKEAILLINDFDKLEMLQLMKQSDFRLHDENQYPIVNLLKNVPTVIFALVE